MKYYVGIDGGATKTEAVLCDENGRMLSRCVTGPSNFSAFPEDKVRENIRRSITGCADEAGIGVGDITSVYAGLAGGMTYTVQIRAVLDELFGGCDTIVNNAGDAVNIISCGLLCSDGIGVISGTGSCCFARTGDRLIQVGGWGYFVDKRGSGFDIGRDVIGSVLCAMDGRGEDTVLKRLYEERTGTTPDLDMEQIYDKGVQYIASLAPLAFEAEAMGDKVAAEIIDENMAGIACAVKAARSHFDSGTTVSVALGGGIFKNKAAFDSLVRQTAGFNIAASVLPAEPVFGAVVEAMRYNGFNADEDIRNEFISTYHK